MEATPRDVQLFRTADKREPFREWQNSLIPEHRARVMIQVRKYGLGNICNAKSVGDGITEIRVDYGPGYRVYLAQSGKNAYLLTGGHKGTQPTDIAYAKKLWSSR